MNNQNQCRDTTTQNISSFAKEMDFWCSGVNIPTFCDLTNTYMHVERSDMNIGNPQNTLADFSPFPDTKIITPSNIDPDKRVNSEADHSHVSGHVLEAIPTSKTTSSHKVTMRTVRLRRLKPSANNPPFMGPIANDMGPIANDNDTSPNVLPVIGEACYDVESPPSEVHRGTSMPANPPIGTLKPQSTSLCPGEQAPVPNSIHGARSLGLPHMPPLSDILPAMLRGHTGEVFPVLRYGKTITSIDRYFSHNDSSPTILTLLESAVKKKIPFDFPQLEVLYYVRNDAGCGKSIEHEVMMELSGRRSSTPLSNSQERTEGGWYLSNYHDIPLDIHIGNGADKENTRPVLTSGRPLELLARILASPLCRKVVINGPDCLYPIVLRTLGSRVLPMIQNTIDLEVCHHLFYSSGSDSLTKIFQDAFKIITDSCGSNDEMFCPPGSLSYLNRLVAEGGPVIAVTRRLYLSGLSVFSSPYIPSRCGSGQSSLATVLRESSVVYGCAILAHHGMLFDYGTAMGHLAAMEGRLEVLRGMMSYIIHEVTKRAGSDDTNQSISSSKDILCEDDVVAIIIKYSHYLIVNVKNNVIPSLEYHHAEDGNTARSSIKSQMSNTHGTTEEMTHVVQSMQNASPMGALFNDVVPSCSTESQLSPISAASIIQMHSSDLCRLCPFAAIWKEACDIKKVGTDMQKLLRKQKESIFEDVANSSNIEEDRQLISLHPVYSTKYTTGRIFCSFPSLQVLSSASYEFGYPSSSIEEDGRLHKEYNVQDFIADFYRNHVALSEEQKRDDVCDASPIETSGELPLSNTLCVTEKDTLEDTVTNIRDEGDRDPKKGISDIRDVSTVCSSAYNFLPSFLQPFTVNQRSLCVAPKGCVIVSLDYNQIELRIIAYLSQDPALLAVFAKNDGDDNMALVGNKRRRPEITTGAEECEADESLTPSHPVDSSITNNDDMIHMHGIYTNKDVLRYFAKLMYACPTLESVTDEQRKSAKEVAYGLIYGMGDDRLQRIINASVTGDNAVGCVLNSDLNTSPVLNVEINTNCETMSDQRASLPQQCESKPFPSSSRDRLSQKLDGIVPANVLEYMGLDDDTDTAGAASDHHTTTPCDNAQTSTSSSDVPMSASQIRAEFKKLFPKVMKWVRETATEVLSSKSGEAVTIGGCRICVNSCKDPEEKNLHWKQRGKSISAIVQGSAADILKGAIVDTLSLPLATNGAAPILPCALVMSLHDELLFVIPDVANVCSTNDGKMVDGDLSKDSPDKDCFAHTIKTLVGVMERQAIKFGLVGFRSSVKGANTTLGETHDVPLEVRVKVGPSWGQLKNYDIRS